MVRSSNGSGKTGPQQTVSSLSFRLLGQLKVRTGPSQLPSVIWPRLMIQFAANFYMTSFLT